MALYKCCIIIIIIIQSYSLRWRHQLEQEWVTLRWDASHLFSYYRKRYSTTYLIFEHSDIRFQPCMRAITACVGEFVSAGRQAQPHCDITTTWGSHWSSPSDSHIILCVGVVREGLIGLCEVWSRVRGPLSTALMISLKNVRPALSKFCQVANGKIISSRESYHALSGGSFVILGLYMINVYIKCEVCSPVIAKRKLRKRHKINSFGWWHPRSSAK